MTHFRQHQDSARTASRRLLWAFGFTVVGTTVGVNLAMALVWKLQLGAAFGYPNHFFEANTLITLGLILSGTFMEVNHLKKGGAHIAKRVGAKLLEKPRDGLEQRLFNVVHEMSIAAGTLAPPVFILHKEDAINAFAAGWERSDCVIAVTQGALERLSRDELQGVVAHELSHIINGDTRLNTHLIGFVFGLEMVFNFGDHLANMTDSRGNRMVWSLMGFALMVAGSIGWLAGRLLKAAVSRQREYLADASAVQFTRNPKGIGGALQKIAGLKAKDVECATIHHPRAEVLSHMFLAEANPGSWRRWLSLHPSLNERLQKIFGRAMPPLASERSADSGEDLLGFVSLAASAGMPKVPVPSLVSRLQTLGPCRPPFLIIRQEEARLRLGQINDLKMIFALVIGFFVPRNAEEAVSRWKDLLRHQFAFELDLREALMGHLCDLQSLPATASLPLFEQWAWSCACLDHEHKTLLIDNAKGFSQAGTQGISQWHLLTLSRLLEPADAKLIEDNGSKTLTDVHQAVDFLTRRLAELMSMPSDVPSAEVNWCAAVHHELGLCVDDNVSTQTIERTDLAQAISQIRMTGWLERPKLVKIWFRHAYDHERRDFEEGSCILVLRALCVLLETPIPPDMAVAFLDPLLASDSKSF